MRAYDSISAARQGVGRYLTCYNQTRPHRALAERVNEFGTLAVGIECSTSSVGVVIASGETTTVSDTTPNTSTFSATRWSSAVKIMAPARSCEVDGSFGG